MTMTSPKIRNPDQRNASTHGSQIVHGRHVRAAGGASTQTVCTVGTACVDAQRRPRELRLVHHSVPRPATLVCPVLRSRKSSGPQRGTALQRGEGVGFGQDFRPCPRCSGATTVGVEWAKRGRYGTSYRREVTACGAKWPVFLAGMTGLTGDLWIQTSPASKSGSVLAVGAWNPTLPRTSGWQSTPPILIEREYQQQWEPARPIPLVCGRG